MVQVNKGPPRRPSAPTSWEPVARWYAGWSGPTGGHYHREFAIPAVLDLLELRSGERVLDIGCGHGVLAPTVSKAGALYTGVDASPTLIRTARRLQEAHGRFIVGDARRLDVLPALRGEFFDAAVFLLSIQDMDPLAAVLRSAAQRLRSGGRLAIVMTHPCFRVPRQSGWGWDAQRKLPFRRVDRYLTPLAVPMKAYRGPRPGATRSFHRPLESYINGLAAHGLLIDCLREFPPPDGSLSPPQPGGEERINRDIPLFLGLRARKPVVPTPP